jgi:hypothetical protein
MEEITHWFSWGVLETSMTNDNPNIRRQKRQRIYGTVTGVCCEWKYTAQFV